MLSIDLRTRIDSKRKMDVSEIEVDLSAVSSNGSNHLFTETKYNKGFHWNLPGTLLGCRTLTIRCHMRKPHERNVSAIQFSVLTVIQAERRVGIWKVENFKQLIKYTPNNYVLKSAGKQLPSIVLSGEKCDKNPVREKILESVIKSRQELDIKESGGKQLPSIMPSEEAFQIKVSVPNYARCKRNFLICKISCLTDGGKIKFSIRRSLFFEKLSLFCVLSRCDHDFCHPDRNSEIVFKVKDIDLTNGAFSMICDFIISNGEGRHEVRESNYLPNKCKSVTNSQLSNSSIKEENNPRVPNIPKEGTGKSEHELISSQELPTYLRNLLRHSKMI
ncbi:hypothetical protein AVEN_233245-1 [Araneus ventricosus]|uniref:Uncharacterized protein n=1 Tax=Araneus ventricosus TaxID=182803 RepID=A0A4Y2EML6_ARAVE|nr:hypothetical protein AVEN_233245-1 [Araneus ventricosus]